MNLQSTRLQREESKPDLGRTRARGSLAGAMSSEPEVPPAPSRRAFLLTAIGMAIALGALFASIQSLPFFSETYNHAAVARAESSWLAAFELARVPLRPLQHLYFHGLTRFDSPAPALARLPGVLLHLGSAFLVICLAVQWGARRGTACLAGWLFLAAPNVKNLIWVSAINAPGRVFCILAVLVLYRCYEERRNKLAALGVLVAFACAIGFHQAAIVAPVLLMAGIHARAEGGRVGECMRAIRSPLLLALTLLTAAYVFYMSFLREARHHGPRSLESLPANAVKGTLALVPEELRQLAVEALRGNLGAAGYLLGGVIVLLALLFGLRCLLRGSAVVRFVAICIAVDLGLHVLTAGFDQRYSYLSSAFLAVGLAVAAQGTGRTAKVLCVVLVPWWFANQARDIREYRAAGDAVHLVLDTASAERARLGPDAVITVVDLPEIWGSESDMPIFDWGFPQAMNARGGGAWVLLRTSAFYKDTSAKLVTREEAIRQLAAPGAQALIFNRSTSAFVDSMDDVMPMEDAP